jgi:hypothetical protein
MDRNRFVSKQLDEGYIFATGCGRFKTEVVHVQHVVNLKQSQRTN